MEKFSQPEFYAGTSGLILPVKNKLFYSEEFQDKSRLTYYASLFKSIEINSSFYKVPMSSTVRKWAEQVPDDFRFTFKLWREITHNKGLQFKVDDVERFIDVINNVGSKKGCLLIQFPPSLKSDMRGQLEKLIINISEADTAKQWKTAFEFRHGSWYHEEIFEILEENGFGIVIHDKPGSATPFIESDVNFKYLRFHGPNGDYKGHYPDDFVYEYAEYAKDWIREGKSVFAYFNNTMGDAIKNLNELNSYVTSDSEDL
ncbi:DUF72 domain-containing protein [Dyadobacter sp. CY345]|uniref:DUF72 domain-containing protein n=1 Tax=Dyadobacter sp. CY345 TaxID=2909335 RepID=UPI001F207141|nr:DUF72 domain-containing protein [Dyadobacter sp. CY345]MCF2443682.1 DUF72 domain-containing protein [Dyadobacter sp. CY345]